MNDTPSEPVPANSSKGTIPCAGTPAFPFDIAGACVGDYRILAQIGEGGMGAVYLAEDTRLHRRVAIKTLKPDLAANQINRDRFIREARAAAAIDHENVVPILHIGDASDGTPFIVMPFLQGESLDARLKRDGTASLDLLLKVACEVSDGLAEAHAKGLIHRDIKPANVWLEGDPTAEDPSRQVRRCKVLDFGLARTVDGTDVQITGTGAVLGTPAYMAPEQAQSKKLDARADLFSLGATLYRAAAGKLPFEGTTPMAVLIALTTETPRPIRELAPHLPPEVADLIDRLMSKEPTRRPRSAAEVSAIVRTLIDKLKARPRTADPLSKSYPQEILSLEESGEVEPAPEPPAPLPTAPSPSPAAKQGRLLWVIAGVCLLALIPLGLWRGGAFDPKKTEGEVKKDEPPKVEPPKKDPKDEPPKKDPPIADPERAGALYVLSLGGSINVDTQEGEINSAEELPKGSFRVTRIALANKNQITAEGLAPFKYCADVYYLGLLDSPVGDEGLAHFARCTRLTYAYLEGTNVSAKGLAALKDCTVLQELNLNRTQVDNAAVEPLKQFTKLDHLFLQNTKITATGVADLAEALNCEIVSDHGTVMCVPEADRKAATWVLNAGGRIHINRVGEEITVKKNLPEEHFTLVQVSLVTKVPDADLAALARCKNLRIVYLVGTEITNAGLTHLKDCKNLTELYLSGTKIDKGSIPVLTRFKKLNYLAVGETRLTDADAKEIAKALPDCTIHYNGGVLGPKK